MNHSINFYEMPNGLRRVIRTCSSAKYGWMLLIRMRTRDSLPPIEQVAISRIGRYSTWREAYDSFETKFKSTDSGNWRRYMSDLSLSSSYKGVLVKSFCRRCRRRQAKENFAAFPSVRTVFDYRRMSPLHGEIENEL